MEKVTTAPMRRCCGCGESFPKSELIRIAGRDGKAAIDMQDRAPGRGIYLCKNLDCIAKAEKRRAFGRGLHTELPGEVVAQIVAEARAMVEGGTPEAKPSGDEKPAGSSKAHSLLGFAARARKIVSGADTCSINMKKGSAKLLIIAGDAAENTKDKLTGEAERFGVPCKIYGESDRLSQVTGKSGRTVFAVIDDHFAQCILSEIEKEVF